jgi:DNA-directed RNA polymerase specialized sigma24 family protein
MNPTGDEWLTGGGVARSIEREARRWPARWRDDIRQDCYLALLRSRHTYRRERAVLAVWLRAVLRREAASSASRQAVVRGSEGEACLDMAEAMGAVESALGPASTPEDAAAASEQIAILSVGVRRYRAELREKAAIRPRK